MERAPINGFTLTASRPYVSHNKLIRASRDGDQFHYLWAARRCLHLLSPLSGLVAVAIEGVSPSDVSRRSGAHDGEDVIDVTEYYGREDPIRATFTRYTQLKHSTERATSGSSLFQVG